MRNTIITLIALMSVFCASDAVAQGFDDGKSISVRNLELLQENNEVKLSFTARIGRRATKSDFTLTIIPTLSKGSKNAEFAPIVVKGKRAEIINERTALATSNRRRVDVFAHNGEQVEYTATIPFENWMPGSELGVYGITEGCCSAIKTKLGVISGDVMADMPVQSVTTVTPGAVAPGTGVQRSIAQETVVPETDYPITIIPGERPATTVAAGTQRTQPCFFCYSFVANVREYKEAAARSVTDLFGNPIPLRQGVAVYREQQQELDAFIDLNRIGALPIHFPQGQKELETHFRMNATHLKLLKSAIEEIESSSQYKISRIVVAGFASPEGSAQINHMLGWERGKTLERFLLQNSRTITSDMIDIYNGQVDWRGLREYVANSYMPDKQAVLNVIDNVPIWDPATKRGRLTELKNLRGGAPYRYLYHNVFPDLRNATCVRIYYTEK